MRYRVVTPVVVPPSADLTWSARADERTAWTKIGRAWSDDGGDGKITVVLDALPFRSEFVYLFPEDGGPPRPTPGTVAGRNRR